ncbi:MAG: hypothetical protein V2A58_17080 [Planctomycetota bacterium]
MKAAEQKTALSSLVPPLSVNVPAAAVWAVAALLFVLSLLVADARRMSSLNSFLFALSTSGACLVGLLTARHFVSQLPYALLSAPVVLPLFWVAYVCLLPLAYLYRGSSYSALLEPYYVETQFYVCLATAAMCLGLALAVRKLRERPLPVLLEARRRTCIALWTAAVLLSTMVVVEVVSAGAFDRGTRLETPMGKLVWIASQLSPLAAYVVLALPAFLFRGDRTERLFYCLYRIAAALLIALVVLRLQLRLIVVVAYLFLVVRCAYRGKVTVAPWLAAAAAFLLLLPILPIVRVSGVAQGGSGLRSAWNLVMFGATTGVRAAYGGADVEHTDEWERAGDTFSFTASTLRSIGRRQPHFHGELLMADLRFLVPYMLYPEKYDRPLLQPEILINMRARGEANDTGFGPVLYLWAEAGPLLVVAGMFLFGLAYGWIYRFGVSHLDKGWPLVFYSLFLLSMMNLEEDWIMNLLQPARMCAVWALLWFLASLAAPVWGNRRAPVEKRLSNAVG